jgi:hypothetical protein
MRRVLIGLLAALSIIGYAQAAGGPSYQPATQPLGSIPDVVLIYQGAGCPTNAAPCSTLTSPSLRFGQPLSVTCSTIALPWQYQQCIDTSLNPPVLKEYIGSTWWPIFTLNSSTGVIFSGTLSGNTLVNPTITGGTISGSAISGGTIAGAAITTSTFSGGTITENGVAQVFPASGNIVGTSDTQTLTNKTIVENGATQNFPASGVIVGTTDSQVITNKTINCANNTCLNFTTLAPVGTAINVAGSLATAGTTVTMTADNIIVGTSLTGAGFVLPSYSQLFNGGVTGAGGMDTGALPSSGFVCLYAIYNPGNSSASILGTLCTTSSGTIYSGTHLPSGYTASALIAPWLVASSALDVGYVLGRTFYQGSVNVITLTASQSLTEATISSFIPPNAKTYGGFINLECGTTPGANTTQGFIAGDANGAGEAFAQFLCASTTGATQVFPYSNVPVPVSQQTYVGATLYGTSPEMVLKLTNYSW